MFRSFIEYHSYFPSAGVQPHAVGVGEQDGIHILHGGNGLHQGRFFCLCPSGVVQIHVVGRHLHEADIAQVHIGCIESKEPYCHQEKFSRYQHSAVLFEQGAKAFSHQDSPLPVYWMNISSKVGSWEWMLIISSWAKGMPASNSGASMVFVSRCP